jgi:HD-GYP domain-containing protein (c-di-GMP phosphodiesterase class II)
MLASLLALIEARDPHACGHGRRTAELAVALGERLGWRGARLGALRLGALLHDVGKVIVPEVVLRKPGPLEPLEIAAVRRHPVAGAGILAHFRAARAGLPAVLFHHERWDGGGYPEGRAGREIPADARIVAVADAFDAMTTRTAYRRALRVTQALAEIERCAGAQFDPLYAELFVELWESAADAAASAG